MAIDVNIPSQVKNYANLAAFPATGTLKTIFIAEDTNKTYRWTGSAYVEISPAGATGVTIGTTAITSGTVGRVLFEGTGNVVSESANITYDNTNVLFTLGSIATRIFTFRPQDTTGAYGNSCSIRGGISNGRLDFYSASNITELKDNIIILTSVGGPSIQVGASSISLSVASATRLQVAPTTGNILINTTTDAGFKLDVNGTARVTGALTVGGTQLFFNGAFYNTLNDRNHFGGAVSISTFLRVGTNANTVASAILQADSTTKGFLPPRMTTTEKNAIATPATGLEVYDSTTLTPSIYNGTNWQNALVPNSTGNVLINTTTDAGYKLDVNGTARVQSSLSWGNSRGTLTFTSADAYMDASQSGGSLIYRTNGNTEVARFTSTQNVLIGTATDAGFKLDVNGTARIVTSLVVGGTGSGSLTTSVVRCNYLNTSDNGFSVMQLQTLSGNATFFQSVSIGSGVNPVASAQLEVTSTTKGFLPPRMTTTQKNAIATPATGLQIYDSTLNRPCFYDGTSWITL